MIWRALSEIYMQELVIEPGRMKRQYWRDLWRYKELFYFLAWRDILIRYKQTVAGVGWAVGRPLLTMVVFTVVFGKLAAMPSAECPIRFLCSAACCPGSSSRPPFPSAARASSRTRRSCQKVVIFLE